MSSAAPPRVRLPQGQAAGSSIQNVAPSPGALMTPISPPCSSVRRLARVRPIPWPSMVDRSRPSRLKGSKIPRSAEKMAIALQSKNPKSVADSAGNVFHYSKVHEYAPLMGKLAAWKQSKLVWNALMCGAGPTLMAICQSENSAKEFADSLKADSFWKHVMVSKTA